MQKVRKQYSLGRSVHIKNGVVTWQLNINIVTSNEDHEKIELQTRTDLQKRKYSKEIRISSFKPGHHYRDQSFCEHMHMRHPYGLLSTQRCWVINSPERFGLNCKSRGVTAYHTSSQPRDRMLLTTKQQYMNERTAPKVWLVLWTADGRYRDILAGRFIKDRCCMFLPPAVTFNNNFLFHLDCMFTETLCIPVS